MTSVPNACAIIAVEDRRERSPAARSTLSYFRVAVSECGREDSGRLLHVVPEDISDLRRPEVLATLATWLGLELRDGFG